MIFDTYEYFKNNRDIQILVDTKLTSHLYKTFSSKRKESTVQVKSWFGLLNKDVKYMHLLETHENVKIKAYNFCVKQNPDLKIRMVTKQINWMPKEDKFVYGNDVVIWTSWDGWHNEIR